MCCLLCVLAPRSACRPTKAFACLFTCLTDTSPDTYTHTHQQKHNKNSSETCFLQKGSRNLRGWYVVVRGSVLRGYGDGGGSYTAADDGGVFALDWLV